MLGSTYMSRLDFALQEARSFNREAAERNKSPKWLEYSMAPFSYIFFSPQYYTDSFNRLERNLDGTYTDVLAAFGKRIQLEEFHGTVREIREAPHNRTRWEVTVENGKTYSWRTMTKPPILPRDTVSVRFVNEPPYVFESPDGKTIKLWGQEPTVRKLPVPV